MGRIIDNKLPVNIYEFFRHQTMTGIASTVDQDGFPRGAPMSLYYAPHEKYLFMALDNTSSTFHNLVRDGRVAVTFVAANDTAFTVKGQAQLFKPTMECTDKVGVVLIHVLEVKSDVALDVAVTQGIKTEFRSSAWKKFVSAILRELRSYQLPENLAS